MKIFSSKYRNVVVVVVVVFSLFDEKQFMEVFLRFKKGGESETKVDVRHATFDTAFFFLINLGLSKMNRHVSLEKRKNVWVESIRRSKKEFVRSLYLWCRKGKSSLSSGFPSSRFALSSLESQTRNPLEDGK